MSRRLAPTRSNLQALARRRHRVQRGASLLRRKREVLVRELFRIARPALEARDEIADDARQAYAQLLTALSVHGEPELRALGLPERELPIEVEVTSAWGVEVPTFGPPPHLVRSLGMRDQAAATVGPAAEEATTAFERLVERLVAAAPRELLLERLGEHLARTTRQVNMLEQRLAPRLEADHAEMRRVLEEREREDHVRLRALLRRRG